MTLGVRDSAHRGQVVTQIVEAQLAVGHIRDIALVGCLPPLVLQRTDKSPQNLRRRCILTADNLSGLKQQVPA